MFGPPPSAPVGGPPLGAPPAGPPPGVPTAATPTPQSGGIPSHPAHGGGTQPATAPRICNQCGANVPQGYKFCGQCGSPIADPPQPDFGQQVTAQSSSAGSLTLIRPDGTEGGVHAVRPGENKIGRDHGDLFENDGYLSPTHAELVINGRSAVIRDLDSLNGVFVRMTEEERIEPGQIIRLGQELLRFDTIEPPEPLEDGTEVMGSPNPGYWGKITVILGKDVDGSSYPLLGDSVTMGRERGDINFPDDGYVSGLHARLFTRDGDVFVADLGSSNGTFIKVQGEREIGNDSFVLLGQQLFRLSLG